jgi:hypothetical protein
MNKKNKKKKSTILFGYRCATHLIEYFLPNASAGRGQQYVDESAPSKFKFWRTGLSDYCDVDDCCDVVDNSFVHGNTF